MSPGTEDPADAPTPKPGTVAARRAAAEAGGGRGPRTPTPPVRRRPRPTGSSATTTRAPLARTAAPAPTALAEGERAESTAFLLQSLRDLEREREAGDLTDEDYEALRDDYTARAAAALRAEERGTAPPPPVKRRRSPTQWALIVAGIVGFAVLAGVLVAQAAGERLAGDGLTGEVTQTPTQAAGECINLTAQQQQGSSDVATQDILACYQDVLDDDPDNPVARTYLGWTLYITARQAADSLGQEELVDLYVEARRQMERAVEADPAYADARAFLTVLAAREGRYEEAAEQLAAFDDLDAPADMALLVEDVREEIAENLGEGAATAPSTTVPG